MAQQKPLSTTAAERMNLVAQDEIWRYRLKAECEAQENWLTKWGYLTTSMEKLLEGEEEPHTPKPKIELPSHFRVRPVSPMDKYIKVRQGCFYTVFLERSKPYCKLWSVHYHDHVGSHKNPTTRLGTLLIRPSPPIPQTTQGFIGWRSGVPGLNKCLEHDTEIRSCKGTYARELHWPEQGVH